jgi:pre-rRNA-processing protein TSR2
MSQPVVNSTNSAVTLPATLPARFDLHIALTLWSWPALSFAITNAFGGSPEISRAKREWLAGAISELLTSSPPQLNDVEDLEEVLLQAMNDEFEVVVDDGSAEEVARGIWNGCEKLSKGETADLERDYATFLEKQKSGKAEVLGFVKGKDEEGEETDWDEDDEEEFNGFDDDVDMDEVPQLVQKKEKALPEIDEDGFTKVVGKKKR